MPYDGKVVELGCKVIAETDLALKCDFGDKVEWIPKSLVHADSEVWMEDQEGAMLIPEWLAKKKGLI
jgi:hypothetical protein